MSITKKTLLVTVCLVVPLFLAIYFVSEIVAYRGFEKLERNNVDRNLLQGQDAVMAKLHGLDKLTEDWSNWDATYYFATDNNQAFIDQNLMDTTFITTEINLIMVFDKTGKLLLGRAYDLENTTFIDLPQEVLKPTFQQKLNAIWQDNSPLSGILLTTDYPLLISARPILNNFGEGPATGAIVFGMFVSPTVVQTLADTTHLDLSIKNYGESRLPAEFANAQQALTQGNVSYIKPLDSKRIVGYSLMNDMSENPALILRVETSRDIYAQGQNTIGMMHLILLMISAVFFVLFVVIIRKMILSRIITLDGLVKEISSSRNNSKRVSIPGSDELTRLASNINNMLVSLEKAEHELMELYESEKASRRELEEEAEARSQFINVLAHELRTPLTPILLSVEAVRDILSSEKELVQYKMIENACKSAFALNTRLEELLDLARFARGVFKLNTQSMKPGEYLEAVVKRYKPALDQKRQTLEIKSDPDLPSIKADASRLEQVVLNLLSNASKYSPENSRIWVNTGVVPEGLLVEIRDEGIGIAIDEQARLFTPYHRAEQDRQSYPGIGLGLAVSSQIIQAHGGRIWVESERGQGSSFKFTLPLDKEADISTT